MKIEGRICPSHQSIFDELATACLEHGIQDGHDTLNPGGSKPGRVKFDPVIAEARHSRSCLNKQRPRRMQIVGLDHLDRNGDLDSMPRCSPADSASKST